MTDHYYYNSENKISSRLARKVDESIKSSRDPLQSAKDILEAHMDRPYFNDLKDELRLLLMFRKIRESPELISQITNRYRDIWRGVQF